MAMSAREPGAARAFVDTLAELGLGPERLEDPAIGRRAALLVAPELAWEAETGPLLDARAASALLGARSRNAISDLARRGRALALPGRPVRYPASQFGPDGRPYPVIGDVIRALRRARLDDWTIAAWLWNPQLELDGDSPAAFLRAGGPPERVRAVAERAGAPLER